jgi:hypothetical protein
MTFVELFESLWKNIAGEASCIAGTGWSHSYVLAVLVFEIQWLHIAGSWGQQLTGNMPQVALYEVKYGHLQILLEGTRVPRKAVFKASLHSSPA